MTGSTHWPATRVFLLGAGLILALVIVGLPGSPAAAADSPDPPPTAQAGWSADAEVTSPPDDDGDWGNDAAPGQQSHPSTEMPAVDATDNEANDAWVLDGDEATETDGGTLTAESQQVVDGGGTDAALTVADAGGWAQSDGSDPIGDAVARTEAVPAQRLADESVVFELAEVGRSGVSGTATLSAAGGDTVVVLAVDGAEAATGAGLFFGTCGRLAPVPEALFGGFDPDGAIEVEMPEIPLDGLRGAYAVAVYVGTGGAFEVLACGDIPAADEGTAGAAEETGEASAPGAAPTAASEPGGITSTGVGTTAAASGGNQLVVAILLGAVALMVGGVAMRRGVPHS